MSCKLFWILLVLTSLVALGITEWDVQAQEKTSPSSFDVPPKEIPGPVSVMLNCKHADTKTGVVSGCTEEHYPSTFECEDKSRFLLMSEDGKLHCLNLSSLQ